MNPDAGASSRGTLGGFTYRWIPARDAGPAFALLLLHGTGGNEDDLIPLADMLASGAAMVSPRGRVLEHGMPRFFRRIREGVLDIPDLKARASQLADFIVEARNAHPLGDRPLVALGFSNGANIAGGLLLAHPGALQGAVLLRPMVPYEPESPPRLAGLPVFIGAGVADPFGHPEEVRRLEEILRSGGARVTLHTERAAHDLTRADLDAARAWLEVEFGGGAKAP